MQMTKNGIPIDVPGQRKKVPTTSRFKAHRDFYKFKTYATLIGFEDGYKVTVTVPLKHPEFKNYISKGFKVIEVWDRRDSA